MAPAWLDDVAAYLDAEKTDWIVEQGERQLEHIHSAGEAVDKKAQLLLNVCIGLATGLMAFIVAHWDAKQPLKTNFHSTGALWVAVLLFIAAGFVALSKVKTENFTRLGSRPKSMLHPEFVKNEMVLMKRGYLFEIERRIELDEIRHGERCAKVNMTATLLMAAPIAAIIIEIVLLFF